jgi:eukaryotic-like serine/threonine-protein kinase
MNTPFNVRSESWARLSALLDEAYELDAAARAALIDKISAEDAHLGQELARLLGPIRMADTPPAIASGVLFTSLLNDAFTTDMLRDATDNTGLKFGGWTLTEKIGQGGMGEVWRAVRSDGMFQGSAAIKLLRSDLPADKLAARFALEGAVLARLNHPNIARLLDAGVANDQAFIVLELVRGSPLLVYAASSAPTVADRVRLIRDLTRAVEHAHSQLVLHRDLKPSNVLVTETGNAKLLDFGIAAALDEAAAHETAANLTLLTGRGLTLEYAAPEQILGEPTAAASDVYSLGAMLFHLLTGQRPFAGNANRAALQFAAVHTEAPRASDAVGLPPPGGEGGGEGVAIPNQTACADPLSPNPEATGMSRLPPGGKGQNNPDRISPPQDTQNLRGDLDAIIAKALRKSPAERYVTASAFAADLDAWLAQTPISIRSEERSYRSRLWLKRNWKLAALGATAAAAVTIGLGVSVWQRNVAIAATNLAQHEAAQAQTERARAQSEAMRASKVADYLGELIQSASPDKHDGKWPTVLTLLEQSEKDLDRQFGDDPKTQATLLKRMAETNDALNRDSVALAQFQRLRQVLMTTESADSDNTLDVQRNTARVLRRMSRHVEALAIEQPLLAKVATRYGAMSEQYANLQMGMSHSLAGLGRMAEAKRALADGAAIITRLYPDDLGRRVDRVNDATALLTQRAMWREALDTLATVETHLPAFAKLGGSRARDALMMRRNLEAMRIRVGRYEGVERRLQGIRQELDTLLGKDNTLSIGALDLLGSLACETGRFAACVNVSNELIDALARQAGNDGTPAILAEKIVRLHLLHMLGQTPQPSAKTQLDGYLSALPQAMRDASARRGAPYRMVSDAATAAGLFAVADEAQQRARNDLAAIKNANPERAAQVDRAAALTAYARGNPKRAADLLNERFRVYELAVEGDSPRRATLWLQRALYEIEFDSVEARKSVTESRAIFDRVGGPQPHLKALLAYVDARINGNADAVRAAQSAVDRAYLRPEKHTGKTPWRAPLLPSL